MLLLFLLCSAQAADLHTGVPVVGVDGLGPPMFQDSTTGWTADMAGGFVRVFTGATVDAAEEWVIQMRESMERYRPQHNPNYLARSAADEAWGDGIGLLIIRDDNVGIMVRNNGRAGYWAELLEIAIVDLDAPWPTPPALIAAGQQWTVETTPDVQHIAFEGGRLVRHGGLVFTQPPTALVAWDGWGRAARWDQKPGR
jgi:hypothetical protein